MGDNQFVRSSLNDVRTLERVAYGVLKGALAGAAAGVYVGYGIGEPSSPGGWLEPTLIFTAVGTGIGAGIGIIIDSVRADRNLLYKGQAGGRLSRRRSFRRLKQAPRSRSAGDVPTRLLTAEIEPARPSTWHHGLPLA